MKYVFDFFLLLAIDLIVCIVSGAFFRDSGIGISIGFFFAIVLSTLILCFKLDQLMILMRSSTKTPTESSTESDKLKN